MNYKNIFKNLGLTNINDFFNFMQNEFKYGWLSQDGKYYGDNNDADLYRLQSPQEMLQSHTGICWDMTELARCFFENMTNLKYETYYIFYEDFKGCPSHSILAYYQNDKVYWFEPMFNNNHCYYSGIHNYNNIKDLLNDAKRVFIKNALIKGFIPSDYKESQINIYKYAQPPYHINGHQMRDHIDNSEKMEI